MQALTGRSTNGFAEPGTTRFHTIWPTDNHEVVHTIVILHLGFPPRSSRRVWPSPIR